MIVVLAGAYLSDTYLGTQVFPRRAQVCRPPIAGYQPSPEMQLYRDPNGCFSIEFPQGWKADPYQIVVFFHPQSGAEYPSVTTFVPFRLYEGYSGADALKYLRQHQNFATLLTAGVKPVVGAAYPTELVTFEYLSSESPPIHNKEFRLIFHPGKWTREINVKCSARVAEWSSLEPVCDKMLWSYRSAQP